MKRLIIIASVLTSMQVSAQTSEEVYTSLLLSEVKHPEIVLAQSILETGWYKSYGCTNRKNLFGFYWKGAFKEWSTWQQSVKYYKDWQDRHYKGGDYYQFLEDRGYAEDPEYINKLKKIVKGL